MPGKGQAQKDDSGNSSWAGISCVDGKTVVPIKINPITHGMLIDTVTLISVTPQAISNNDEDDWRVVKGVSSVDGRTILPFYVNPATGAILAEL